MEAWHWFNEFILSDESGSDEDDDIGINRQPKMQDYVKYVVDNFSDEDFRKNFRMHRQTFEYILELVNEKITVSVGDFGRNTIGAKEQLLLTIWYFATPDSYRSICGRFNIGTATGFSTVHRVTNALLEVGQHFIRWPTNEYADVVMNRFAAIGFGNTIGCIDGCYIPIPFPKDDGRAYICRKHFPCIVLQGVCDHQLLFTHCYAGEVGSVHDAKILKNSEIWQYMNDRAAEMFPGDSHLLGDKAYPISPQLMTPYKDNGHLTRNQRHFNYKLSAARSTIERTFGLLKKRFRCMKFLDVRTIEWIPKYIIVCCILHNICILQNDVMNVDLDDEIDINNDQEGRNVDEINANEERERRTNEIRKRDQICANML